MFIIGDSEPTTSETFPDPAEPAKPKTPRKPRPSEIAAKKAREAAKRKAKPAPKKKTTKTKRPKTSKRKAKPAKRAPSTLARLDIRLTKAQRARVVAKAKKLKRSITSIVLAALAKVK